MEKYFVEEALNKISSENYDEALCDLRKAIKFNAYNEIAYVLKIRACLHLGDLDGLAEGIKELKLNFPKNNYIKASKIDKIKLETLVKNAKKFSIQKKYDESVKQIDLALQIATSSKYLSSLKNQYMIEEKDQVEVKSLFIVPKAGTRNRKKKNHEVALAFKKKLFADL